MEKLRRTVSQIAYTRDLSKLSAWQRALVPLLSFTSSVYEFAVSFRNSLYRYDLFQRHRLPVPVISVGNLTWGGNGKTPMVEFLALWLANSQISPLILTRGYGGGDEVNMLERHLSGTSTKIGTGANRFITATHFLEKYGYIDPYTAIFFERRDRKEDIRDQKKVGAIILDDGMQHLSLWRDIEIVMVNGLMPWGNCQLIPRGPLRESLTALGRADLVVIHHADLLSELELGDIELTIVEIKANLPTFFSKMIPLHFFSIMNVSSRIPLAAVRNALVLCVSAIGFANAFVRTIEKIGPSHVHLFDFSDHYMFQLKDIEMIKKKLGELEQRYNHKPVVVMTEKDYDRDPEILEQFEPYKVLVLCSQLQIIDHKESSEEKFKDLLEQLLVEKMEQNQ